jgi:hypothetical protein
LWLGADAREASDDPFEHLGPIEGAEAQVVDSSWFLEGGDPVEACPEHPGVEMRVGAVAEPACMHARMQFSTTAKVLTAFGAQPPALNMSR